MKGTGGPKSAGYYVQFAQEGPKGFRAEAVSNRFLSAEESLHEIQLARLAMLGWLPPDPDPEGPRSNVNHYREWPQPAPIGEVVQLAVSTLRRVFMVKDPDQLQYRSLDESGSEYLVPTLGLSPEPRPAPPTDTASLRPFVEEALRKAFGLLEIEYDKDGDIPLRFERSVVFVSFIEEEPPLARIFGFLFGNARASSDLLEAINDLNLRTRTAKVIFTGRDVMAVIDLSAPGLTEERIAAACFEIGATVDHFHREFEKRFGDGSDFQLTTPEEQRQSGYL